MQLQARTSCLVSGLALRVQLMSSALLLSTFTAPDPVPLEGISSQKL